MKTSKSISPILAAIIAVSAFALGGCATAERTNTMSLLTAAGFRERVPETPKQKEIYNNAESYKMLHAVVKGKTFYAYKDEAKGVAYIGGPAEYQKYKELAIQQRIAQDNYMAAEMNRDAAMGWYGAWGGPGRFWW
jgi:hypothetical protein